MRVLVTGATGFTGGHLARHLAARGHQVRALVRDPKRAESLSASGIELAIGDLRDEASIAAAVRDVSVVHNIAALYREAGLPDDTYFEVNARAVGSLIASAGSSTAARLACTGTWGRGRRTRMRRSRRATCISGARWTGSGSRAKPRNGIA